MSAEKKAARTEAAGAALGRYRERIEAGLRQSVTEAAAATPLSSATANDRAIMYGQLEYHLGWRSEDLTPATGDPGKLVRPALTLLAAELTGGPSAVDRALPVAVTIELIHNFSLIHDDIEDRDESRRGRPTLWKLWGQPQAINSGDGLFSLARMRMWRMAESGVSSELVVRLAALVDRTCLELCEGQHLDMRFEGRRDVTEAMYLDMIGRKTAALMACAAESGARVGAPSAEALGERFGEFGRALGMAFQLRDDVLGIWSAAGLGKSEAGDVRRKMTLPVIHALERATEPHRAALSAIYAAEGPATEAQVAETLEILDRSGSRERAYAALREQLDRATAALRAARAASEDRGNSTSETGDALAGLVEYIRADARN